ncbi:type II toxin-antitoxin system RelE/ParE family toxin [Belliella sp. R4-6]|uniref:Type II toxin-antitoxin system RelE/ParE family toxin n=1 Tax=Belliella alkalica TaxID=1730871 RepID=A0ABS9VBH8_9BACT|nr:type II toxin-antitoxin system RelE/ParE family toxin [Belliella alkalica]MCH7413415.1 type II toxin-antitoxin system RelE/ParE family toxin [Belliella alkalica]
MVFKIKFTSPAKLDIDEVIKWYDGQKKGLGRKFYNQLKSKVNYIQKYPYHCQLVHRDIRNVLVDKFPFQISFVIEELNKMIVVVAVTHTRRNPKNWKNRS